VKVTHWRNLLETTNGTEKDLTWDELCELLSRQKVFKGQNEHPGWSPAEFTDSRRSRDTVTRVWALTLDHDAGEALDAVAGRLDGLARFQHTTRKHTPEAPRCRVVVQLSRSVSPFEYEALWRRFAQFAGEVDPAPKDPSRFWFLPGCPLGAEFVAQKFDGLPLDVDHWLAKPDPTAVVRAPSNWKPTKERASVVDRARRYIARMPEAVAGSGGHAATWDVALVLARGFDLSESDTFELLAQEYNPRCSPSWSEKELRHKAKQASQSRAPGGFLLQDDTRDWRESTRAHRVELVDPMPADDGDERHDTYESPSDAEPRTEVREEVSTLDRYKVTNLRAALIQLWEKAQTKVEVRGFTTGVPMVDEMTCGIIPGEIMVLGAGSSWGKSSFSVQVADENIKRGVRVLVVSVEDDEVRYAQRIAARRTRMNALNLRDNRLSGQEIGNLGILANRAEDVPFVMRAIGQSAEWCAKGITAMVREHGIQVVICDYLQRFKTDRKLQDRRNEVTYALGTLSDAIKNSGAAGLILSQLKRTDGKVPTMEDLKESGDIEIMTETVLLGHRTPRARDTRDMSGFTKYDRSLYVPKNKFGPVMADTPIDLEFDEVSASFQGEKNDQHYSAASAPMPNWTDHN
jgi:hypothetical protein